MIIKIYALTVCMIIAVSVNGQTSGTTDTSTYLAGIKKELTAVWPKNRTINLVFHGHSVPAGYWNNHEVHTLESYPYLLLKQLKEKYPYAVINVIVTAIGGENSLHGQQRFIKEVLIYKPDVLFIDYALNDLSIGLEKAYEPWEKMIKEALKNNIKVILVTPSPDQRVDILASGNKLELHAEQIRRFASKYHIGLADPFAQFQRLIREGGNMKDYMSHVNHPNKAGHEIIAKELMNGFLRGM